MRVGQGIVGGVAASGEAVLINDIPQELFTVMIDPAYRPYQQRWGIRTMMVVPLTAGGRVIGTLGLARHEANSYTPNDLSLAQEIASRVALAVAHSDLHEQLAAAEQLFHSAFDEAPIGMAVCSLQGARLGELIDVNREFCHLAGRDYPDLIGMNANDLTHPDDRGSYSGWLAQIQHGQTGRLQIEKRYLLPDGQVRWVKVSASPVRDEQGKPLYLLKHVEDITASRAARLEQSAELLRSAGDLRKFAYLASHDLQTPLRTVGGFTTLLAASFDRDQLTPQQIGAIDSIQEGVGDMHALIAELLEFTRIESRYAAAEIGAVSLRAMFDEAAARAAHEIADAGARVSWAGADVLVAGSEQHLYQVVFNLLQNAIRYRSPDRQLSVSVCARVLPDDTVELAISDNGVGIAIRHHDRVFEMFRQLQKGPGTGMGLPVAARIVELHGGTIQVRSETGIGTTMLIRLPQPAGSGEDPAKSPWK